MLECLNVFIRLLKFGTVHVCLINNKVQRIISNNNKKVNKIVQSTSVNLFLIIAVYTIIQHLNNYQWEQVFFNISVDSSILIFKLHQHYLQ